MLTKLVLPPTIWPITVEEAKEHLRITHHLDDAHISALIKAATNKIEAETNRALMTQTIDLVLDVFPAGKYIKLPRPVLQSVTSISYFDQDGNLQTFPITDYDMDTFGIVGLIRLGQLKTWPTTRYYENSGTIRYVAGYASADEVPQLIKVAIKLLVAHMYENREPVNIGNIVTTIPMSIDYMISQYRVHSV